MTGRKRKSKPPRAGRKKYILKPRSAAAAARRTRLRPGSAPEPSLDAPPSAPACADAGPAWIPAPTVKNSVKLACASLSGDIIRVSNRGARGIVECWDPDIIVFPALSDPAPDTWPREYELAWMRPCGPDEPACAQGPFCQGFQLATVLPPPQSGCFALPVFVSPAQKSYWGACILCARLAHTRNGAQARPWAHDRPFRITELEYSDGRIVFS